MELTCCAVCAILHVGANEALERIKERRLACMMEVCNYRRWSTVPDLPGFTSTGSVGYVRSTLEPRFFFFADFPFQQPRFSFDPDTLRGSNRVQ